MHLILYMMHVLRDWTAQVQLPEQACRDHWLTALPKVCLPAAVAARHGLGR